MTPNRNCKFQNLRDSCRGQEETVTTTGTKATHFHCRTNNYQGFFNNFLTLCFKLHKDIVITMLFKCCFVDSKYLTKLFKKLGDPHSIVQHWFCLKLDNNYCVFILLDLFVCILTIIILGAFGILLNPISHRGVGGI